MKLESVTLCSATLGEDGKREPPLGPLYIAETMRRAGLAVDFRDYQLGDEPTTFEPAKLVSFLRGHSRCIAISCFVDMLPLVIEAARQLNRDDPSTIIVLGGPGPTASAARIVEKYPWIHAVVRGEGEETIVDWLRALQDNGSAPVAGMVRRCGDVVVDGGERQRIRDLDELPPPAYDLLPWSRYSHSRIITTRGCSYRCSFCDVTALWGNRSVFRSLPKVMQEMELLKSRYGKSQIAIVDDTFVLNRDRVRQFCNLLIEHRSTVEWGCFGRINLMTPELVELMRKAGCRAIFYGIDSGSQFILDATEKRIKREDIIPCLKWSSEAFQKVEASFIWGYPFESHDDFLQTLDLAAEASVFSPTVNVQLHMLSPLPMSPIYRQFKGGLLEPEQEDRPWLLLPPLLLEERARALQSYVRDAPEIFPGFFSFPTPHKEAKRELLTRSMRVLDQTIGATLFDDKLGSLLGLENRKLERSLLKKAKHPSDRIGLGLALGLFRRTRRRATAQSSCRYYDVSRGRAMKRQRNEELDQTDEQLDRLRGA